MSIDPRTVAGLKGWKKTQTAERHLMGSGWLDTAGVIVTEPDGSPVHPQVFSRRFKAHASRAGLPEVRLHDTRPLLSDRGIGRWSASEGALKATQSRRHRSVVEDLRARHAMRRRGRYGIGSMEATPGIEPGYTALQAVA